MSFTLRGRVESRLAALVPIVVVALALTAVLHRWWPVEAIGLMVGVGLALDAQAYDRLLAYQPGWAALPLGALELALLLLLMRALGVEAPLPEALALFLGGWLLAQLLGQAGFPLLRLGYAEDGGELGRLGGACALAVGLALAGAGATAYALRPPVVHLAAGVYKGPLVITRRETLVGEAGAVVRGGIVVRANDVTVENVAVVGGENGITVDGVHGTVLDGVSVSGAKLDGIHVRLAGVVIKNCTVDMYGDSLGQGIDISYNMGMGMSMIEGCTVVGGMEGIVTHSSMSDIVHDRVSGTQTQAISVTEMSMGTVMDNDVSGALGIGIYCNDRSTCMIEHNTVVDTRPDTASGNPTRRGFGVLASFQSLAELRGNQLTANPVPMGAVINSEIAATH
jgi:parallel beta-helix repeat protein